MLDAARAHFPELVGYLLVFGAHLGLVLGALSVGESRPRRGAKERSRRRACRRSSVSHARLSREGSLVREWTELGVKAITTVNSFTTRCI